MTDAHDKPDRQPTLAETVTTAEIEALLGVAPSTRHEMTKRGDIPEGRRYPGMPYRRWLRKDIGKVAARMAREARARAERLQRSADELLPLEND